MGAIRGTAAGLLLLIAASASAADCLTEGRVISTRSSVPNLINGPIAWSGSVFAVAKTQENVSGALWVSVYGESFDALVADRQVAANARSTIALLWNGSEFGLFYRTLEQGLRFQRLTMMGAPIGAAVAVTPERTVYVADEIDIVWSPALNAYVVARAIASGRDEGLWITVLDSDGTRRRDQKLPVALTQQSELDIAVSETGVIGAAFINFNGTLAFAVISPDGSASVRSVAGLGGTKMQVASQNGLFVVTRAVFANDETAIRWLVFDSSPQVVRADALLIEPPGDDVSPLALVATEDELALAYVEVARRDQPFDTTYRLRRFTIDGTFISDTAFAASNASQARATSAYPFVWTGRAYVSAPVRLTADRANSFLVRYCPLDAQILTPRDAVRVGTPVTFSATATGGVPAYEFSWIFPAEIGPKKGQTLNRVFTRPGTYQVTLVVTDFSGDTVTKTVTVVVGTPKMRGARH